MKQLENRSLAHDKAHRWDKTVHLWPALQSVLMLKHENTPFCDLEISKLSPLSYRSTARYTNTPFPYLAVDLLLRKRLH